MRTYSNWDHPYECALDGHLVIADTFNADNGVIQLALDGDVVATAALTATFVRICRVENPDADESTGRSC